MPRMPSANESIDYIEGRSLNIPLMASHSNARAVAPFPAICRTLSPKRFSGERESSGLIFSALLWEKLPITLSNISPIGWKWEGKSHLAFGADFFNDADLPSAYLNEGFFKEYPDASCYPSLLSFLQKELGLNSSFLNKVSHQNALSFIKKLGQIKNNY